MNIYVVDSHSQNFDYVLRLLKKHLFCFQNRIQTVKENDPFCDDCIVFFFCGCFENAWKPMKNQIYIMIQEEIHMTSSLEVYRVLTFENFEENLIQLLNHLHGFHLLKRRKKLPFCSGRSILYLDVNKISCLKYENRKVVLYMDQEAYFIKGTLRQYTFLCHYYAFKQTKRTMIINLDYNVITFN